MLGSHNKSVGNLNIMSAMAGTEPFMADIFAVLFCVKYIGNYPKTLKNFYKY